MTSRACCGAALPLPSPAPPAPPPCGRPPAPPRPAPAGATCLFAYLYVRPLIRRRLGSASRAYINYSTIYICWLLLAVFYHLPSLESLGERACLPACWARLGWTLLLLLGCWLAL